MMAVCMTLTCTVAAMASLRSFGMQARPLSAGAGAPSAAAQEAAVAAVEEEWSGRMAEALALCAEQEAALERLQCQNMRVCK